MNEAVIELIGRRRRQIIVHSCIYYRFNSNIISDQTYDAWAKELAKLQEDYPKEAKAAALAEAFKDFGGDSTTGFLLPYNDPRTVAKAQQLIRIHQSRKKDGR